MAFDVFVLCRRSTANSLSARSACPGINALANHGWLPHNGRDITYDMLVEAVRDGFAFDLPPSVPGFANNTFHAAISDTANLAVHPEKTAFDMDTINTHNGPIEIDGSISRKDDFFGNSTVFDRPTWDTQWRLMEEEQEASGGTGDSFDLRVAARARARHVLIKSQAGNEEFLFTNVTLTKSAGTTALYMLVLGGMTKSVKKDWLWAFFGMFPARKDSDCLFGEHCTNDAFSTQVEERIPYKEGFQPQKDVNSTNLGDLVGEIIAAAPADLTCSFNPDAPCPGAGT